MSSNGQIASIICKNFTQNAWKKDLCSNCFKSEVEHQDSCITNCNSAGDLTAPVINTTTKPSQSSDAQNNQKGLDFHLFSDLNFKKFWRERERERERDSFE